MLGSVVPSSSFLVNDMMRQVDWERARVLVEYGPGVGTFTREILKRMRPDAALVAIELNTEFVEYLRERVRDPRFRVVHGSAARVRGILAEQSLAPADYIISSLPYRNMPDSLRREILEESRMALKADGSMLLYPIHAHAAALSRVEFQFGDTQFSIFQHSACPDLPLHALKNLRSSPFVVGPA